MTVKELNKYSKLSERRRILMRRAEKGIISDEAAAELKAINKQLEKLSSFILNCRDSFIKEIMIHRFIEGLSWDMVAARMGGGNSADSCRKLVTRYISHTEK